MNDFKEWYQNHFDDCEYCGEISERKDLTENEKSELIDEHTMNSYGDMVDRVYEAHKES